MVESFPAEARIDISKRSYLNTSSHYDVSPLHRKESKVFPLVAGPGSKTTRCSRDPTTNAHFDCWPYPDPRHL